MVLQAILSQTFRKIVFERVKRAKDAKIAQGKDEGKDCPGQR